MYFKNRITTMITPQYGAVNNDDFGGGEFVFYSGHPGPGQPEKDQPLVVKVSPEQSQFIAFSDIGATKDDVMRLHPKGTFKYEGKDLEYHYADVARKLDNEAFLDSQAFQKVTEIVNQFYNKETVERTEYRMSDCGNENEVLTTMIRAFGLPVDIREQSSGLHKPSYTFSLDRYRITWDYVSGCSHKVMVSIGG